jgi:hypothetical protein
MDGLGGDPADAGFDDDPGDEEPIEGPDDLNTTIGEIAEPISDEQLLIVGVRGLQKYFDSDVVTFVKDVEYIERLAESVKDASAKQLSTGQKQINDTLFRNVYRLFCCICRKRRHLVGSY